MGLLEGALILLAGILLGRFLPSRRKHPRQPEPVCGCDHHHSFHDPQTGECHAQVRGAVTRFDADEFPIAWELVPCSCRRYSGPEPLPEVYAPEIAGGHGA